MIVCLFVCLLREVSTLFKLPWVALLKMQQFRATVEITLVEQSFWSESRSGRLKFLSESQWRWQQPSTKLETKKKPQDVLQMVLVAASVGAWWLHQKPFLPLNYSKAGTDLDDSIPANDIQIFFIIWHKYLTSSIICDIFVDNILLFIA